MINPLEKQKCLSINCKGKLLTFETPKIMGILNVTPDSFFDGGKYNDFDKILFQVEKMLNEGADIIDIGGMSSRPGAAIIDDETELKRTIPIIEKLIKEFSEILLSIDTVKAVVAQKAVEAGARIVNDISAGNLDSKMFETIANLQVPYILMHMLGQPKNMQDDPKYDNDIVIEIMDELVRKIAELEALGVKDIIIDPGFGFGKTVPNNYEILKRLSDFSILEKPILAGLSRKSMIYKVLNCEAINALNGTTVLHTLALLNGASILRVHDVKEAKEAIDLLNMYNA